MSAARGTFVRAARACALAGGLASAVLLIPAGHACAQTGAASTGPAATAGPGKDAAEYIIAPDDVLNINVVNFQNLCTQGVVLPDGNITVPLLGAVSVKGKTVTEVAKLLQKEWNKYVVDPVVSVSVSQKRKAEVVVNGFAARVGALDFRPGMHVTDAFAQVGGAPAGDLTKVTLTRRSGETMTLDVSEPEKIKGTDKDILLTEGDILFVPERRLQVSVVGEVMRPGSFDYKDDMTVLDLMGLSGGVKPSADLDNATLLQGGKETKLDLDALLRRGDMSVNCKLKAQDRIMIPELQNRTYVFGAVAKPGYYPFKPGDRILDALDASGVAAQADLRQVRLIQVDKAKKTAVVTQVNLEDFLKKGDMAANRTLSPGDVLFLPDRKRPFQLQDAFGVLSGISMLDNTFRILSGNRY